jgi:hypothetical protein
MLAAACSLCTYTLYSYLAHLTAPLAAAAGTQTNSHCMHVCQLMYMNSVSCVSTAAADMPVTGG